MKIVCTCGDVNGIAPEILFKALALQEFPDVQFALAIHEQTLRDILNTSSSQAVFENGKLRCGETTVDIISCSQYAEYMPGIPTKNAALLAIESLDIAFAMAKNSQAQAIVTMPISKKSLYEAGWKYNGQTDLIAELYPDHQAIMMLFHESFRVTLATIHIPLLSVAHALSTDKLFQHIKQVQKSLKQDFAIVQPTIAVLGLNPHAGEQGLLGTEEELIITPAIHKAQECDIICHGPFPADGFFARHDHIHFDAVIAMYHDQGLIPLKMASHGNGVNATIGVPIIRTSPDHGTAFDIAGKNIADPESTVQAIKAAIMIANNRLLYDSSRNIT